MTINGTGYKEVFLRCASEGYDAAEFALNKGVQVVNPYRHDSYEDYHTNRYEYEAWESGWWWYASSVH